MEGKIKVFMVPLNVTSGKFFRSVLTHNKEIRKKCSLRLQALREKCPNTEFFLVRIFPHSAEYGEILLISPHLVWIRENTDHKKLRVWTLFTQWWFKNMFDVNNKDTRTVLASVLKYLLIILKIFKAFFCCFYN